MHDGCIQMAGAKDENSVGNELFKANLKITEDRCRACLPNPEAELF